MHHKGQIIALVTGANRGIGLEVCRQLSQNNMKVILTSRNVKSGEDAVKKLASQGVQVDYCQLSVADAASIDQAYDWVKNRFGRLDVLVNNAGIYLDRSDDPTLLNMNMETLQQTFEVNTMAPIRLIQKFIPLMKKNNYGRIVNVSSGMGQLSEMSGRWPAYRISKTALNAVTRIAADELKGTEILVNAVCPGWVKTDMGGAGAHLSVEEGADSIVWLASLPADGPTGGFFRARKRIDW